MLRVSRLRRVGIGRVVIDVDGCMTDGSLIVGPDGTKLFKSFGPDDHDAIRAAQRMDIDVQFVTADRNGADIVVARAAHMGVPLKIANTQQRMKLITPRTVYIGDGIWDWRVMEIAGLGIAPNDAWPLTRKRADAVTSRNGGHRAVAQAIDYIMGLDAR